MALTKAPPPADSHPTAAPPVWCGMLAAAAHDQATDTTVQLQPLSPEHLQAVKTLNSVLFPVKYHVRHLCCPLVPSAANHAGALLTEMPCCAAVQDRVYEDALACGPVSQLGEAAAPVVWQPQRHPARRRCHPRHCQCSTRHN